MLRFLRTARSDRKTHCFGAATIVSVAIVATIWLVVCAPALSWACACGCGVFEVGTASLFPRSGGGTFWLEYDYMDQYINWHATQVASATRNDDKRLQSHFMNAGLQYMFNRDWGAMIEIPYTVRYFRAADEDTGKIQANTFNSIGDIRLMGMYTGLSEDMSTGLQLGVKVPSGWWTYPHADRDTQIGTGSTNLLAGAYHLGTIPSQLGTLPLTFRERPFNWFVQAYYDAPMWSQENYTPGREFDGALGTYYNFGVVGPLKELAPMLTLIASDRVRDTGTAAAHNDSGYTRLMIAPGGEIKLGILRWYADIEIPFFQNMVGNQITAPFMLKTIVSYDF